MPLEKNEIGKDDVSRSGSPRVISFSKSRICAAPSALFISSPLLSSAERGGKGKSGEEGARTVIFFFQQRTNNDGLFQEDGENGLNQEKHCAMPGFSTRWSPTQLSAAISHLPVCLLRLPGQPACCSKHQGYSVGLPPPTPELSPPPKGTVTSSGLAFHPLSSPASFIKNANATKFRLHFRNTQ